MEANTYNTTQQSIDLLVLLRKIIKRKGIVLLAGCFSAVIAVIFANLIYTPLYSSSVTLSVSDERLADSAITSLQNTTELAAVWASVVNSTEFEKAVCEYMGVSDLNGKYTAAVAENTNLITLRISSSNPQTVSDIFRAVNDSYPTFTDMVMKNAAVTLLEEYSEPIAPSNSKSVLKYGFIGFAAGIFLAVAIIVLLSVYKNTVNTENDITDTLSLPILGCIPTEKQSKKDKHRGISIIDSGRSPRFVEAYKDLRASVEAMHKIKKHTVWLVAGARENEGKTTVAANLALSLALMGRSVLLLDCNFANPAVSSFFGANVPENAQLSDYLAGNSESNKIIRKFRELPLYVAGNRNSAQSFDIVASKQIESLIEQAKQRYDYVIIDSSACCENTDAFNIAEFADASIFVIRENYTDMAVLSNIIKRFNRKGNLYGAVLNYDMKTGFAKKSIYESRKPSASKRRV